jgi:hypothetical protein
MEKYDKPSEYWMKYVLVLVQLYCVPHPNVRKTTLESIILLIHTQIKQSFKINEPKEEFVFLLEDGSIVEDFIDIPFSTSRLYLTKKQSSLEETMKSHSTFLNMIRLYE